MAAKRKPTARQVRQAKSTAKKTVKAARSLGISPALMFLLILLGTAFVYSSYLEFGSKEVPKAAVDSFISKDADLEIHYIDVGQGDCSLILWEGASMLIDSGESQYADTVLTYLEEHGVDKLDYIIATHPHSDHMGGMAEIISSIDTDKVIAPKTTDEMTPTTNTYRDFLNALSAKAIKLSAAKTGTVHTLTGTTAASVSKQPPRFEIIAPVDDYDDLNNYSIMLRLTYGSTSYLFTGDIERQAERDVLETGAELDADVLKVAHHGSSSSTCEEFYEAVSPRICVISCGKNNDYGHPHAEVVELIDASGAEKYQTDRHGTVVVYSDGKEIFVRTEKEPAN